MSVAIADGVTVEADGRIVAARGTVSAPRDRVLAGLERAAFAVDDAGDRKIFAGVPRARVTRAVARIARHLARHPRDVRVQAAAATVLLAIFEAYPRAPTGALAAYLALYARVTVPVLRDAMTFALERVAPHLPPAGRAALAAGRARVLPATPPYAAWFGGARQDGEVRIRCQVQDVFFASWRHFFRRLGFRPRPGATADRIVYVREDVVRGVRTRFVVDYVRKGQGLFTAMADPRVDVVMFLGHSDWWARVPRNLAIAPDARGAKLIVLVMCFGKHFFHALHARYPDAQIVTTKDPTEDPEDVAMLRHVLAGIAARASWRAIHRAASADRRTQHNFIYPDDVRYVAGVVDEDRDGRVDRVDRFCNVGARRVLAPLPARDAAAAERAFVPDPIGIHPRGAAIDPRELDGAAVFEAALLVNSLSYDNFWLDLVNRDQRVVAAGWHLAAPGDATCARLVEDPRTRAVRLSCSTRYARAPQPVLTALVVADAWRWWAARVRGRARPSPLETHVMGALLVAHALGNADYPRPDVVFHAFLRRAGYPPGIAFRDAYKLVEDDEAWESGSPKSVARFVRALPAATRAALVRPLVL